MIGCSGSTRLAATGVLCSDSGRGAAQVFPHLRSVEVHSIVSFDGCWTSARRANSRFGRAEPRPATCPARTRDCRIRASCRERGTKTDSTQRMLPYRRMSVPWAWWVDRPARLLSWLEDFQWWATGGESAAQRYRGGMRVSQHTARLSGNRRTAARLEADACEYATLVNEGYLAGEFQCGVLDKGGG